jgi:hypothetical protein
VRGRSRRPRTRGQATWPLRSSGVRRRGRCTRSPGHAGRRGRRSAHQAGGRRTGVSPRDSSKCEPAPGSRERFGSPRLGHHRRHGRTGQGARWQGRHVSQASRRQPEDCVRSSRRARRRIRVRTGKGESSPAPNSAAASWRDGNRLSTRARRHWSSSTASRRIRGTSSPGLCSRAARSRRESDNSARPRRRPAGNRTARLRQCFGMTPDEAS